MGCNKIPETTIVAFGSITDTCFKLHTHHGYKYYSTSPLKYITENGWLSCSFLRYQEVSLPNKL